MRFYTTSNFADDVDEVLADLDYAKANLVGISYGATAEQVFSTRHPDRVRTMTLLSGTLLDVPVLERFPENAQRALDLVFDECERDAACQQAFPAAPGRLGRAVALGERIALGRARRPVTDRHRGSLDANWVASALHDLLFVATTHTRIPLLVHTVGATDDKVAAMLAIAQAYPDTTGTGSGDEQMLRYSHPVQRGVGPLRPRPARRHGQLRVRTGPERRRVVAVRLHAHPRSRRHRGDRRSHRRPTCPSSPSTARRTRKTRRPTWRAPQRSGRTASPLTVPGQGHDIDPASAQCEIPLIQSFIDQGAVTGLDTTCLAQLPPPAFDLTLPGS